MNRLPPNGSASPSLFTPIRFKDFAVSWAGPNPLGPGFAFGSEDGRVLLTDEAGVPFQEQIRESITDEAINGIAGSGMSLAVSSRDEVVLLTWTAADPHKKAISGISSGAHGIITAASGSYVAPLGRGGIMILPPNSVRPDDPIGLITPGKEGSYSYRVIALTGPGGKDLLICAARQGGMGVTEYDGGPGNFPMKVLTFVGLDLVDVCAVGGTPDSPAVAGVGRDGTLLLVRDALNNQNPVTIKFEGINGTAYRLLSARGHLFVLTSRGLFGLMNLGERLVKGLLAEAFTTPILVVPMEAVDANLIGDRWLLVTRPDEVLKFDVELIDRIMPENRLNGEVRDATAETLTPDWKVHTVQQASRSLEGAV
jgi:hypothetical protein